MIIPIIVILGIGAYLYSEQPWKAKAPKPPTGKSQKEMNDWIEYNYAQPWNHPDYTGKIRPK